MTRVSRPAPVTPDHDVIVGDPPYGEPVTCRPVVGITTYTEVASWGVWSRPAVLLPESYVTAVAAAGAAVVLLPAVPGDAAASAGETAEEVVDRLDGIVVAGGPDVDPVRYGGERQRETGPPTVERDAFELALVTAALDRDLPLLGVCRGMQVLNVACGGTLVQHLPAVVGHDGHRVAPATYSRRTVRVRPGSRLADVVSETVTVACYHHQAIDRLGSGVRPAAVDEDGTVEAVEVPDRRFAVGVQWHPEEQDDRRLFGAFVAAAASNEEVPTSRRAGTQPPLRGAAR